MVSSTQSRALCELLLLLQKTGLEVILAKAFLQISSMMLLLGNVRQGEGVTRVVRAGQLAYVIVFSHSVYQEWLQLLGQGSILMDALP
jgi:hypothetical protein